MNAGLASFPPLPFAPSVLAQPISELEHVLDLLLKAPNAAEPERYMLQRRGSLEHLILLLEVVKARKRPGQVIMICSIEIKNMVRENWQAYRDNADASALEYVRNTILLLFLLAPFDAKQPVAFFKDALVAISRAEEGGWWPGLAQTLVSLMSDSDHDRNLRCLKLLSKLTNKYEEQSRSDPLYAEIIEIIGIFHDKLLMFVQGYINTLAQGVVDQVLILDIIRVSLKVFYRFVYQDIHPKIEDAIAAWASVIRQVLVPEFGGSVRDKELVFKTRGEATKVCMFVSTKYKEDFHEHVRSFINTIWDNCVRLASGGDEVTLVNSIGFFKSFASSEEYLSFFAGNIGEIVERLLLPGLVPDQEDQNLFTDEPEAFAEQMFSWPHPSFRRRHAVADLTSTLAKFHRQGLVAALQAALEALEKARSLANLPQQLAFLDLFALTVAPAQTTAQGANTLIVPLELPREIWARLCEALWGEFAANSAKLPEGQVLPVLFAVSHHCRFAGVFRYALDVPRVVGQATALLPLLGGQRAPRIVLLSLITKLLDAREFSVVDNLSAPEGELSFFQRYYNNPRKLSIVLEKDRPLLGFRSHPAELGSIAEALLRGAREGSFDAHSATLLLELSRRAEGAPQALAQLAPLLEAFCAGLLKGGAVAHSDVLVPMFEALGALACKPEGAPLVSGPLLGLAASPEKLQPEALALALQALSLLIRQAPAALGDPRMEPLAKAVLSPALYAPEALGAAGVAGRLAAELAGGARGEADWPALAALCERLLELRLVRAFFEVQELLVLGETLAGRGLALVLGAARAFASPSSAASPDQALTASLFFRLFLSYFCFLADRGGFDRLLELSQKSGSFEALRAALASPPLAAAIATQGAPRTFQFLVLGKVLMEDFKSFEKAGLQQEFSALMGAVIENLWNRRFNTKALAGRIEDLRERDGLNKISGNALVGAHRLKSLELPSKAHVDQFLAKTGIQQNMVDPFLIEKINNFAWGVGATVEQFVSQKKHLDLFVKK